MSPELEARADAIFGAPPPRRRPPAATPLPAVPSAATVLGLDLALKTTGWAVVRERRLLAWGHFKLPDVGRVGEARVDLDRRRYAALMSELRRLSEAWGPSHLAFEYPERIGRDWWNSKRGPLVPYYLGLARGLLIAAHADAMPSARLVAVPMGAAKRAMTRTPNASKDLVRRALGVRGIDVTPMTEDESDAVSIALVVFEGEGRRAAI
jgi:Holliday junction resolvasome RuvABC endonuclease subunit